ncbi:hypothetical protein EV193_103358 [Herbihabitans rhizosphaerae]|uniref:Uncharacterized protein n=1 Tax=Herbihabitans rhizosphaerae TaxID=1872711 RepID=A0A4Q7KXJ4_9PSEU|nr:hypothetical protein [Herbihabitans rhizosphaerae]RZS41040.1 hypothetical protein EV193_103358 [Herbihabitans rhizosphaerae]
MAEISHEEVIRRFPELAPLADQQWTWEERPLRHVARLEVWGTRRETWERPAAQLFIYGSSDASLYWIENGNKHTVPNGPVSEFVPWLAGEIPGRPTR